MDQKKAYYVAIEDLLRSIPSLERDLDLARKEHEQKRIGRALHARHQRLERLIPFPFRLALHNLCKQAGVSSSFIPQTRKS